jgi:hypothetical protein
VGDLREPAGADQGASGRGRAADEDRAPAGAGRDGGPVLDAVPLLEGEAGLRQGDAYDNALAETVNGLYKTEVIRSRGPWRSIDEVEFATLEWVDWFNHRRLLEPIGWVPPAEFEAAYYRAQETPAQQAGLN